MKRAKKVARIRPYGWQPKKTRIYWVKLKNAEEPIKIEGSISDARNFAYKAHQDLNLEWLKNNNQVQIAL